MATNKNTSPKFDDIISKSTKIPSGSPAVYQLTTKTRKLGPITIKSFGEKNANKINKTILLVGESGAGKSTLVNVLVNHAMEVEWKDEVWFQILDEQKVSQTESQTSDVTVYEIYDFKENSLPYSLTIIDTPGYGNTRGTERDDIITERLLELVRSEDGVREMNAVGLVLKGGENRMSDRLMYILDSVVSLFGKDMEKNIIALITHSNGRTPKNVLRALEAVKIKCARNEKNQPVHFLFDNCQHEDRTEEEEEFLQTADQTTKKGLHQFAEFFETIEPQKVQNTLQVLNKRIRLTACIQNLQDRVKLTELKQKETKQIQEALKKHEDKMKKNENFIVEVDEVYRDKEPIDGGMSLFWYGGATCCTVCEENCHHPGCTLAWYPEHCKVMKNGFCVSCTNKCPASTHVKEKWIYVTKTRKVQKTLQEVKKKYEQNETESRKQTSCLADLEKTMEDFKVEKKQLLEEAYQHVVKLEQIALNINSVSTHVHLDFLIDKMREEGDAEKVQKLEEMRGRMDERVLAALRHMFR